MMKNKNQNPILRFSPTAWAKLVFMRDMTHNEVGGFGITRPDDLLFVTDFILVKQKVTVVSVLLDDMAVADYFDQQVELDRKPEQFARIWLHTHPGSSPNPSGTDEQTFSRVFGACDWSVMFILAQDGNTYARLHFKAGPGGDLKIPVHIDYHCEFEGTDTEQWVHQYKILVTEETLSLLAKEPPAKEKNNSFGSTDSSLLPDMSPDELLDEIDQMDPLERQAFMNELAIRSDFWEEYEKEVLE